MRGITMLIDNGKHSKTCARNFPTCPCLTCANDANGDWETRPCCEIKGRKCDDKSMCPDFRTEDEK